MTRLESGLVGEARVLGSLLFPVDTPTTETQQAQGCPCTRNQAGQVSYPTFQFRGLTYQDDA